MGVLKNNPNFRQAVQDAGVAVCDQLDNPVSRTMEPATEGGRQLLDGNDDVDPGSPGIGLLAIITSYTQLLAYGFGFLTAFWRRIILGKDEFSAFSKNFYK